MCDTIKIAGIVNDSIVDGAGLRYSIFVQGCPRRCPGCHNPKTHDFEAGETKFVAELQKQIEANPLLSGITLSGGEPFCQCKPLIALCEAIKNTELDIAAYTGYTFEELLSEGDPDQMKLLSLCDVLVDGPFVLEKRDLTLHFRGSENQRILNVKQSLKSGKAVLETSERWN